MYQDQYQDHPIRCLKTVKISNLRFEEDRFYQVFCHIYIYHCHQIYQMILNMISNCLCVLKILKSEKLIRSDRKNLRKRSGKETGCDPWRPDLGRSVAGLNGGHAAFFLASRRLRRSSLTCVTYVPSGKLTQLLNMAIEIVDFPMKHCDFTWFFVCLPEGKHVCKQTQQTVLIWPSKVLQSWSATLPRGRGKKLCHVDGFRKYNIYPGTKIKTQRWLWKILFVQFVSDKSVLLQF